ncbi:MAG: AAA family ATPase [Bacteroidetes bacterium]|nr:AAA family ATPase [Bacteroidota bacterium]
MKIRRVNIKNFRCFDDFEIIFPEYYRCNDNSLQSINLHVLLAPNMTGKSALLKAIRISISTALQKLKANIANPSSINISHYEHRVTGNNPFADLAREVKISTEASNLKTIGEKTEKVLYKWTRYKEDYSGKNTKTVNEYGDIGKDINTMFNDAIENKTGIVPIFLFVGTEYIHQPKPVTDTLTKDGSIKQGYWYCLDDKSMEAYVFDWFEQLYATTIEQQRSELAREYYDSFASNSIATFKLAVKSIIPEITDVDWVRDTSRKTTKYFLVFRIQDEGVRTYEMLSDGYRYLVLLIGELVTRATLLNKHVERDLLQQLTGVVLIDEFGIHLHPKLQSDTLSRLASLFPQVQFIVTTHSPLLINGLKREQLHIINETTEGHRYSTFPDEDAIGLGAEGILRAMFGLATSLDKISLEQNEKYKQLLSKKNIEGLNEQEIEDFKNLSTRLSSVRLDPNIEIKESDPLTDLVKNELKEKTKTTELNSISPEDLKNSVSSVINKLLNE